MIQLDEVVMVWLHDGRPNRLVWGSRRFRVTDSPTPLAGIYPNVEPDEFLDATTFTHPPLRAPAWRFQATADDGEAYVFDILFDLNRSVWLLLRTFQ
ncbi:hypothetical protein [Subtercola sp. YIM 133946]|uniref:hypothetical protein n=1 Tax=Subtercola sp. YIM 133946 TaxID=3118909 RepID=UPI002F9330C1